MNDTTPTVTDMRVDPGRRPRQHAAQSQRRARPVLHPQHRHPDRQRRPHRRRRSARRREDPPDARGRARPRRRPADRRLQHHPEPRARASPTATPAAAACRPSTCAPPSTPSRRSRRPCSICSASSSACRSPRCSAKASSATRSRCSAICSMSATARKTDLPYPSEPRRRRRLVPPAPRGGADARGRRAPGRGGAGALRLQRLQAQGRRAAPATRRSRR